jgi:hypothetical protein
MVALFTMVGKRGSPCGLRHLDGEGVHRRPKAVSALLFYAVAGMKGVAEVDVGDELMMGSYGGGKTNHVWFD